MNDLARVRSYAEVRRRLFCPPNAVEDTGITMRNGWPLRLPKEAPPVEAPPSPPPPPPQRAILIPLATHDAIVRVVAREFDVAVSDILSERRNRHLAEARQSAMVITSKLTRHSLPNIGRFFNRDHTTVMHAIQKLRPHVTAIENEMKPDSVTEWVVALKERLLAGRNVRGSRFPLRTHCSRAGHPFDEANTIIRSDGQRRCRKCENEQRLLRHKRQQEREAKGILP